MANLPPEPQGPPNPPAPAIGVPELVVPALTYTVLSNECMWIENSESGSDICH